MFKRAVKGDFEYLRKKRINTAMITAFMYAVSLGIILIGYLTTGSKKNLLTIVGVLGLLPASKSMVSLIMLMKAKGAQSALYDAISKCDENLVSMYDMYFTSYKKNFAVCHMTVNDGVIIGYSDDRNFDPKECCEHIKQMLNTAGITDITVSMSVDMDVYINMVSNLNKKAAENTNKERDDLVRISLYEIVL